MISSIDRRRTFTELQRDGRRVRHGSVRMNFLARPGPRPQVAFAIGRSFGNAVERNRGRRRLREAFIEAYGSPTHADLQGAYLLSGNRGLLTRRFPELVRDVGTCLTDLRTGPR